MSHGRRVASFERRCRVGSRCRPCGLRDVVRTGQAGRVHSRRWFRSGNLAGSRWTPSDQAAALPVPRRSLVVGIPGDAGLSDGRPLRSPAGFDRRGRAQSGRSGSPPMEPVPPARWRDYARFTQSWCADCEPHQRMGGLQLLAVQRDRQRLLLVLQPVVRPVVVGLSRRRGGAELGRVHRELFSLPPRRRVGDAVRRAVRAGGVRRIPLPRSLEWHGRRRSADARRYCEYRERVLAGRSVPAEGPRLCRRGVDHHEHGGCGTGLLGLSRLCRRRRG